MRDHSRHFGGDAGLEQLLRRQHVVARVDLERAAPAGAHAGLGGEVVDAGAAAEEGGEGGALYAACFGAARRSLGGQLENVRLVEGEGRVGERALEVRLFDRPRVVVLERVDADHRVPVGQQPVGQVRSDEPGAAGDDDVTLHGFSLQVADEPLMVGALRSTFLSPMSGQPSRKPHQNPIEWYQKFVALVLYVLHGLFTSYKYD